MKGIRLPVLKRILERQKPGRFGADYIPSVLATPQEAPSISRPTAIWVRSLGRHVHCMGDPEVSAALLALHHPALVDLHEQKMMHTAPAHHPLFGFPGFASAALEPVKGTLSVSERMNFRQYHPKVMVEHPTTGERAPAAFPYLGDLLLFLRVDDHIRLVNWPVKEKESAFSVPSPGSAKKKGRAAAKLNRRRIMEATYYEDIGVPTVEFSADKMPDPLEYNLRTTFGVAQRKSTTPVRLEAPLLSIFRDAIQREQRINDVISEIAKDGICGVTAAIEFFYASIWHRKLRVDLFSNIILSAPARPERIDVLRKYAHLFPGIPEPDGIS